MELCFYFKTSVYFLLLVFCFCFYFILFCFIWTFLSEHRICWHIVERTVKRWQIGIFGIIFSFDFTHEIQISFQTLRILIKFGDFVRTDGKTLIRVRCFQKGFKNFKNFSFIIIYKEKCGAS